MPPCVLKWCRVLKSHALASSLTISSSSTECSGDCQVIHILSHSDGCQYALEWTTGMDYWTDLFALKVIFMAYNKSFLPVHALHRFLTWMHFCSRCNTAMQFKDCQHSEYRHKLVPYLVAWDSSIYKLVKLGLIAQFLRGCPLLRGVRCWGVSVKRGFTVCGACRIPKAIRAAERKGSDLWDVSY